MGFCKDCKSWEHHIDCYRREWHECEAVGGEDHYSAKAPEDGFVVYSYASDDSGLNAGLITGPLFGCTKFQPRKA